jgi:hypothetical protein
MPELGLIIVDPGHFHAALVQKEMYPEVSPLVHVYAPVGTDVIDYLTRIARFNTRAEQPTRWRLEVHAGPDFLEGMARERPGAVAIFSGRNRGKIAGIRAAIDAGLHVLADKPVIIRRGELPALAAALDAAAERDLVLQDMMGGRDGVLPRLMQALHDDPAVFGDQLAGSAAEPGVAMSSAHHLMKDVAGVPNPRPAWYFDVAQQGEALADIGTHLVDQVHRTLFPDEALDYCRDIRIGDVARWPTVVSLAQFCQVTGEARWPDYLEPALRDGALDYLCNARLSYAVRGVHVGLDLRWDWQAEPGGDDTATACYRGSRARLEVRHGVAEGWRPQLYVVPLADIGAALERRIAAQQPSFPGIALEPRPGEWRVVIPEALRIGHDAQFAALTRRFLGHVARPGSLPAWEKPNLLAKSFVCTAATAGGEEADQ